MCMGGRVIKLYNYSDTGTLLYRVTSHIIIMQTLFGPILTCSDHVLIELIGTWLSALGVLQGVHPYLGGGGGIQQLNGHVAYNCLRTVD